MKKRIRKYIGDIDSMLAHPEEVADWDEEIRKHLVQIGFFMHERLIHLIVTALFAVLTILVLIQTVNGFNAAFAALFVLLMVLLVPYVVHYYLLENSVQYMYTQYDRMLELRDGATQQKNGPEG